MSDSKELTTGNEGKRQTPADRQKDRLDFFMGELEKRQDQLALLLSDSNVEPKVFLAVARRAFMRTPELLEADPKSVIESFINCATDGMKPDGRQAAIVIYNVNVAPKNQPKRYVKKAQYICMYQGMLEIAYRSGNYRTIGARVVYEGDEWEYSLGIGQKVHHKPKPRPAGKSPEIVAAYAFAITKDGGEYFEPFEGEDIRKVKAVSRAASGPGKDWPEEMTRKGPLRRMWKYIPKDDRMARLLEREDSLEFLDPDEIEDLAPAPDRKLQAGFAPKSEPAQIAHDSTLPMDMVQEDEREALEADFEDADQSEAPKKQAAPEPENQPVVQQQDEPPTLPETFALNLQNAGSWLNIKQALRTIGKDERTWPITYWLRKAAWARFQELYAEGQERTDFVDDTVLFECWLDGENPGAEDLERNYALLQKSPAFQKLHDEDKAKIHRHVEEARQ